jgi:hypothetical protein
MKSPHVEMVSYAQKKGKSRNIFKKTKFPLYIPHLGINNSKKFPIYLMDMVNYDVKRGDY